MPGLNVVINLYKLSLLPNPLYRNGISVDNRPHHPSAVLTIGYRDNRVNVQSLKLYYSVNAKLLKHHKCLK